LPYQGSPWPNGRGVDPGPIVVSVSQNNPLHRPLLVQAPVRALDPDGVTVVTAGTIGFAIGAGVCWWIYPQLVEAGRGWYLGVAITGTAIGVLGLVFSLFRAARRRRGGGADADIDTDAGRALDDTLTAPEAPPRRALETPQEDHTPTA